MYPCVEGVLFFVARQRVRDLIGIFCTSHLVVKIIVRNLVILSKVGRNFVVFNVFFIH